jgi:hypothetical protein
MSKLGIWALVAARWETTSEVAPGVALSPLL